MGMGRLCHTSRTLLALTFTLLCIALAGSIASLLGTSWMKVHTFKDAKQVKSVEVGLIRSCDEWWNFPRNVTCGVNLHLFEFETRKEWDIVAVLLIISSSFLLVAVFTALFMSCCQHKRGRWLFGSITTSVSTFFGAITSLTALIYFEIEWYGRIHVINYDRGWSNMVGWASAGISLGTFAFSCTLACVKPMRREHTRGGSHSSPVESSYPMGNYGNRNQAYQQNDWDKNQSYNGVIKEFYATQASM